MRKSIWIAAVVLIGVAAGVARAGYKNTYDLWISPDGLTAAGSLGGVRNSSSSSTYIECYTQVFGSSVSGVCGATLSEADFVMCVIPSSNPAMIALAQSITTDSNVQFTSSSLNIGTCTSLLVQEGSFLAPKQL